jgi:prepilin-type N-terminal cleavage/methylation domain-containing protein/prepilin-type processing-associated H-X9-DG protein
VVIAEKHSGQKVGVDGILSAVMPNTKPYRIIGVRRAPFTKRLRVEPKSRSAFTLIELMVVIGVIALLISILVPSLSAAREQARTAVCGVQLRQIGIAGSAYADDNRGWIAGSPNTSGNGARPGFAAKPYVGDPTHYPALHVFDWASPLLPMMNIPPPDNTNYQDRYSAAVTGAFRCPSNRPRPGPVKVAPLNRLIPADAPAPSYATSRYFMYVGESAVTGPTRGFLWWSEDCVPAGYLPKLENLRRPAAKAYLADAHVVSQTKGEISNANWGFASHGAWRSHDLVPATYRGTFLHRELWRHSGAINVLAFDGHVERFDENDGRAAGGKGAGARKARLWFPTGTDTSKLPSRRGSEPAILVP